MSRFRLLATGIVLSVLTAACGGSTQPLALVASSSGSLEVGEVRVMLGLVDPETEEFLASPDVAATASFSGPEDESITDVPLEFVWSVPDLRGLYRTVVDLPRAGAWSVVVTADGFTATEPAVVVINQETAMPQVGDPAPAVETPTAADADLSTISSDPDPDPDFYRLSLDEAVSDDRPTVIVFATPAFCTSATCGPVLDNVKSVAADHSGVDFVHVEIYQNLDAQSFEELVTVPAVDEWALPSEPWVFVTDADGVITARFEGAVDPSELSSALTDIGA